MKRLIFNHREKSEVGTELRGVFFCALCDILRATLAVLSK